MAPNKKLVQFLRVALKFVVAIQFRSHQLTCQTYTARRSVALGTYITLISLRRPLASLQVEAGLAERAHGSLFHGTSGISSPRHIASCRLLAGCPCLSNLAWGYIRIRSIRTSYGQYIGLLLLVVPAHSVAQRQAVSVGTRLNEPAKL